MSKHEVGNPNIPGVPAVVDRAAFQAELDALRVREKAYTREGDAIAAARRRLPMVEVDANLALIGPHGPLTLLEAFEGRRRLIAYNFMWHPGRLRALFPGPRRATRRRRPYSRGTSAATRDARRRATYRKGEVAGVSRLEPPLPRTNPETRSDPSNFVATDEVLTR